MTVRDWGRRDRGLYRVCSRPDMGVGVCFNQECLERGSRFSPAPLHVGWAGENIRPSSPTVQPPSAVISAVAVRVALMEFPHSSSAVHVREMLRRQSSSTWPKTEFSVYT